MIDLEDGCVTIFDFTLNFCCLMAALILALKVFIYLNWALFLHLLYPMSLQL